MTAPARITQADFDRALRSANVAIEKSGKPARIIFRLATREIEIIIDEIAAPNANPKAEEWSVDDL